MEIDIVKQRIELETEIATLSGQLQQIDNEIARFTQARNNQIILIAKKQGALELLTSLNGAKMEVLK